jgi:hypothetical protein
MRRFIKNPFLLLGASLAPSAILAALQAKVNASWSVRNRKPCRGVPPAPRRVLIT